MGRHRRHHNRHHNNQPPRFQEPLKPQQSRREPAQAAPAKPKPRTEGVTPRGWMVIVLGVAVVAIGFFVLSLTDPAGQNWASDLSPFLLLGGYTIIGLGIIWPKKNGRPQPHRAGNPA